MICFCRSIPPAQPACSPLSSSHNHSGPVPFLPLAFDRAQQLPLAQFGCSPRAQSPCPAPLCPFGPVPLVPLALHPWISPLTSVHLFLLVRSSSPWSFLATVRRLPLPQYSCSPCSHSSTPPGPIPRPSPSVPQGPVPLVQSFSACPAPAPSDPVTLPLAKPPYSWPNPILPLHKSLLSLAHSLLYWPSPPATTLVHSACSPCPRPPSTSGPVRQSLSPWPCLVSLLFLAQSPILAYVAPPAPGLIPRHFD